MNRRERRAARKEQHEFVRDLPEKLTPVPPEEFPNATPLPIKAWISRKYLVQLYQVQNPLYYPNLMRLSVCKAKLGANGRWEDGLSWDELQAIKREVGYGDWYGMEIYPPDQNIVNVANMRHIWMLPTPILSIGWF